MTRDIAIRLDGMLKGARGSLDMIVHFMKENLSEEEFTQYRRNIAKGMAELFEIASGLYESFPDITPVELLG